MKGAWLEHIGFSKETQLMVPRIDLKHFLFGRAPRLGEIMSPADNSFGVLRLAMASAVLVSHSFLYATGTSQAEPLYKYTCHSMGEHAVQVFFILSGLMVAQSLDRSRNVMDFALARALRIFPGLVVCVLLSALLLGPLVSSLSLAGYFTSRESPAYVLKTVALITASMPLPGVFDSVPLAGKVNTSLWTLKYEVMCYAGLALAGTIGLLSQRWRGVAALAVAVFVALIFLEEPASDEVTYSTLDNTRYFAVYFATGVLAYLVRDRLIISFWPLLPMAAIFYLARGTIAFEAVTAVCLGYGALWAATLRYGGLRTFCNRFDLSFGVYIYAGPLQQTLLDFRPSLAPEVLAVAAMILVLPMALTSWVFIEHPAIKMRRPLLSRLMRRTQQETAV